MTGVQTCALPIWLSNFSAETFVWARKHYPFLDWFEGIIVSGEDKLIKPDPRIYQMMCEALNVDPAQCIYLDDLGINCKPAAALGMAAIKVSAEQQALDELGALLDMQLP